MNSLNMKRKLALFKIGLGLLISTNPLNAVQPSTLQKKKHLPVVVAGDAPFYPSSAQTAGIEGIVRLRLTTDGESVSMVEVESGKPMLVRAAQENVKTWKFRKHDPTSFAVSFQYILMPESGTELGTCEITMHFPSEVVIKAMHIHTSDPVIETPTPHTD
ncbi:MAG TPA: energy transducer TonB [Holophagaceae bacterium]|nr:energy transducer TonB [Holophagaceae bacterium]